MASTERYSRWRPHPWHGLSAGREPPRLVHAYVELTPYDLMKYEIDKATGYLRIDRPQRTSAQPPSLYGFVPRTWCGPRVGELTTKAERGDGDPLDICVLSERPINRAEVLLDARVIGGLQMIDDGEADDKLIAVLDNDYVWGDVKQVAELPDVLVERLRHYFSTYKITPGDPPIPIDEPYDAAHAREVVSAAMADYDEEYGSSPR